MNQIVYFSFILIFASACTKLSFNPEPDPIDFAGIVSATETKEGDILINWARPNPDGADAESYEIYLQEVEPDVSAEEVQLDGSDKERKENGEDAASLVQESLSVEASSKIVNLNVDQSPITLGRIYGTAKDTYSHRLAGLSSGSYALQIQALDSEGNRDGNTTVLLFQKQKVIPFKGLESADMDGDEILLKWQPLITNIKGEAIHYTVYQGKTFADKDKIALLPESDNELRVETIDKLPGSIWFYGVRVKDPNGLYDSNLVIKSIQIPENTQDYIGCVNGIALGANHIQLEVEYPAIAERVNVYREGKLIYTSFSADDTIVDDKDGLNEGETYTYKCEYVVKDQRKFGKNEISVTTKNSNPPTFAGIGNVQIESPTSITASWGVATGVPSQYFAVYGNPGNTVDWGADALTTTDVSNLTKLVEGLGDELPYSFGVRACTTTDICDSNTVTLKVTLSDGGAPKTKGASAATVENGKITITVPWQPSDGAVLKRKVYIYKGTDTVNDFSTYVLGPTKTSGDLLNPIRTIVLDQLQPKTQYNIVVRDEDPSGQENQNFKIISVNSGDLNPPTFNGIASLIQGPVGQEEKVLRAGIKAILPEHLEAQENAAKLALGEPEDASGASHYQIYVKQGGGNSCESGVLHSEVLASAFNKGQNYDLNVDKLQPRTMYSICIKARDSAGNVSATSSYLSKMTFDTTAPIFDGLQTMVYDNQSGQMNLEWNPSSSTDILEYNIRVWKNTATPAPGDITKIVQGHAQYPEGYSFNKDSFTFGSNDKVYVLVNACDDAAFIPGIDDPNCTNFPLSSALSLQMDDIDPPQNFVGIDAAPALLTPSEGTVTIKWVEPLREDHDNDGNTPMIWVDYKGFTVYLVDEENNLEFKKDCPCSTVGCAPEYSLSCNLDGLDHARSYRFHVRAYDGAPKANFTILDPAVKTTTKRTSDVTAPVFNANLSLQFNLGKSNISWSTATDNQYANEEGNKITYTVYRRDGSDFTNAGLNPEAEADRTFPTEATLYEDNDGYASGVTYYYTVCASDTNGNRTCEGTAKPITTPDLIPPTITSFTSTKTSSDKIWDLNWAMTDNIPGKPLIVNVYYTVTLDEPGPVGEIDTTILSQLDATTLANIEGPRNQDIYVNYMLRVEDQSGNVATATLSVLSTNFIEVTDVRSNEGPTSGNNLIVLYGSGFHENLQGSTQVWVGGNLCNNISIVSDQIIACEAPAGLIGFKDIDVQNIDLSSFRFSGTYEYCELNSCNNLCNNPDLWAGTFAAGDGSAGDPYLICNETQLDAIRSAPDGRNFKLGNNVDLSSFTANSFPGLTTNNHVQNFNANFDGDGYVVANWTYEAPPGLSYVGLFRVLAGNNDIKNLGVINIDLIGNDQVGAIVGHCNGTTMNIKDVFVTGSVSGGRYVGAVAGYTRCNTINVTANADVSGTYDRIGGLFGEKYYAGANLKFVGSVSNTNTTNQSESRMGGIAGIWYGNGQDLSDVYVDAQIVATSPSGAPYHTGGIFGTGTNLKIIDPTVLGSVTGFNSVGSIMGAASTDTYFENISDSKVKMTVTGNTYVGGIVGSIGGSRVEFKNVSYAQNISVTNGIYVGGMVGYSDSNDVIVENFKYKGVIDAPNSSNVGGIFGRVRRNATITDSSVEGEIIADSFVGGLLGYREWRPTADSITSISDSVNRAQISGNNYVGGLVGHSAYGMTTTNSYSTGDVSGNDYLGGAFGTCRADNQDSIEDVYATGDVDGNSYIGGFCGMLYNNDNGDDSEYEIRNSYATGDVTSLGNEVGGFIGRINNNTKIDKSYATGNVTGGTMVGGFIGRAYYRYIEVTNTYATGDVVGEDYVGGYLGFFNNGYPGNLFSNNYAQGDVEGNTNTGGYAGYTRDFHENFYASGKVDALIPGTSSVGGLIGDLLLDGTNGLGGVINGYWDVDTSTKSSSDGGTALTEQEMTAQGSFNFDFGGTWMMPTPAGPPVFQWQ